MKNIFAVSKFSPFIIYGIYYFGEIIIKNAEILDLGIISLFFVLNLV
jgi:hypothetical protein